MDLTRLSLEQLSGGLRRGEWSAADLARCCADNHQRHEPVLQAYKTWNGEGAAVTAGLADQLLARGVDLGPLMGLPVSVKDLYAVRGLPTFAGSVEALGAAWEQPGPLMAGLERQLVPVMGKTHTVEFAFGGIGVNAHWGTPRNPWKVAEHRIPGGSSSGAGVSLAQGSAVLALGTDTAGSVRIPASVTGQAGLKLTHGRWPQEGIVPLSPSLDTPGILARSVEDLVFGFRAIEQGLGRAPAPIIAPEALSGLRLGRVDAFFLDGADPAVVAVYDRAMTQLAALGASVRGAELPGCNDAYDIFRQGGLAAPEFCAFLKAELPGRMDRLDPVVRLRVEGAASLSSVDYLLRVRALREAAQRALPVFRTADVLVTPTVAVTPPRLDALQDPEAYRHANMLVLRNTSIANLLGLCAVTLPIGLDAQGLPVGLQLMAAPWAEERLLAAALLIESHLGKPADVLGAPDFLQ
ncbi:amidase [Castellaniella hirudinis]|uniref:Amidase n=1 Tax=Castellaniella hirudinis TaxID=1144617 RepID=A0ABV8RXY7_9BURK